MNQRLCNLPASARKGLKTKGKQVENDNIVRERAQIEGTASVERVRVWVPLLLGNSIHEASA